ncbi:MAG: ABC transporter permease [Faecousia sp.]
MSLKKQNRIDLLSRLLILVVVMAALAIIRPDAFLSVDNISQVVFQQAPFTILMAFGMSLAIISNGIDISMASTMVLSSYLSATFFQSGNYLVGLLVALGVGAGFGLCNGILISKVKIEPFIATFSVDFVALGLAYVVCDGKYVYGFPDGFRALTNGALIPGVPNVALITLVIFAVLFFVTKCTTYGRGLYSLGHNRKAARLSGIRSDGIIISVYVINGILAATTGILYLARLNAADPTIKGTLTIDSIAAALIGGIAFGGGKGSVVNTVIGALVIMFIRNGMNIMGVSTNWQQAVVGFVILFSIFYERALNLLMAKFTGKKKASGKSIQQ